MLTNVGSKLVLTRFSYLEIGIRNFMGFLKNTDFGLELCYNEIELIISARRYRSAV
jgi:hypothetical protein